MKIFTHKFLIVFVVLSWIMLCGFDCHWSDDNDDPADTKTINTTSIATVDVIYATDMDVITDDDVVLTCDLPISPVLAEGDLVYIIIDFESLDDNWAIITVEFDQKL
jgi:hypothetical protein